jgi:ferric-dicitrate binding protein FerR (iron transport regulator)
MSETSKNTTGEQSREQLLQALFAHAKPREAPPTDDEAEIRAAVFAEWDALTGRRLFLRRAGGVAAAAVAVSAAALLAVNTLRAPESAIVARVERVLGAVQAGTEAAGYTSIALTARLEQGTIIATREGQIALAMTRGGSLRLAAGTRLRLIGPAEAELFSGTLYFDSENTAAAGAFAVRTAYGSLHDVGTQFIARVDDEGLQVGVRDGRVAVAREADRADVGAGEKLVFEAASSALRRDTIATFGEEWAWVERVAPPFPIDGRTLADFLTWVSAQTGREVVFYTPATETLARATVLRGSIDLDPINKLAAVIATTDFSYMIDGGAILISSD